MLEIQNIQFNYGQKSGSLPIFRSLNLRIQVGELVTLFGPNGCGKSTLLELVAGLMRPDTGTISFNGQAAGNYTVGFVFQNYREALFPWLTIQENITLPLKIQKCAKEEIEYRIKELHGEIAPSLPLHVYPQELSGGQQQMASILRALIIEPDIFLLDEPFASLDYETTLHLMKKIVDIWQKKKITTLIVSHNIEDALWLSQKIVLFSKKPTRVIQVYDNPLPFPRAVDQMNTFAFSQLKHQLLSTYAKEIAL